VEGQLQRFTKKGMGGGGGLAGWIAPVLKVIFLHFQVF